MEESAAGAFSSWGGLHVAKEMVGGCYSFQNGCHYMHSFLVIDFTLVCCTSIGFYHTRHDSDSLRASAGKISGARARKRTGECEGRVSYSVEGVGSLGGRYEEGKEVGG